MVRCGGADSTGCRAIVDPNKIFEDIAESESKEAKDDLFGAGSTDEDYLFGRKQKLTKAQSAQLNQKRIIQQQKQQREAELARKRAEAEAAKDQPLISLPSVSLPSVPSLPSVKLPF